ncbi:MAG TPA: c-type cytochrome [Terriglobales bacterium]|jgi:cytochrome c oxidase cbb3-type subunit 2|nr:c-type cytochrome [Terriglobales bacterium]
MRTQLTKLIPCAVAVLAFAGLSSAQLTTNQEHEWLNSPAASSHVGKFTGDAKAAAADYRRYCVGCHGELGDGNGENAQWLTPKPRDFQLATFKCRSTPTGTLPTDEDLYETIGRGLDRSNMPSWNPLTGQERVNLVAWIKHYSPRWQNEKPGTPIQIPAEPAVTADRVQAGREIFEKVQCWKCHGVQGMANGPSASTLTDDLGRPISPYNFTDGSRPICGSTDRDIYRIFMTGLDGTPMPSFSDNIKPDEAWDLVFYLRTLQPKNEFNIKEKQIAKQLNLKPVSQQ